jgi:hypothetical protein
MKLPQKLAAFLLSLGLLGLLIMFAIALFGPRVTVSILNRGKNPIKNVVVSSLIEKQIIPAIEKNAEAHVLVRRKILFDVISVSFRNSGGKEVVAFGARTHKPMEFEIFNENRIFYVERQEYVGD